MVRIPIKDTQVMLPVENAEKLGVRDVKTSVQIDELLVYMKNTEDVSSDNWNRRYRENIEKIREGTQERTAEVVKYLIIRDESKGLSSSEKKTLNYAKQILYSEIMMAKDMDYESVDKMIKEKNVENIPILMILKEKHRKFNIHSNLLKNFLSIYFLFYIKT